MRAGLKDQIWKHLQRTFDNKLKSDKGCSTSRILTFTYKAEFSKRINDKSILEAVKLLLRDELKIGIKDGPKKEFIPGVIFTKDNRMINFSFINPRLVLRRRGLRRREYHRKYHKVMISIKP